MRILVLGSGGREHALCWKLSQSEGVQVFATPGNPGIARVATCLPAGSSFFQTAESCGADLTVVGPELPLVNGVVDEFRAAGKLIVGPTRAAAQLEGSKIFAKRFFAQSGIPTAGFATADTPAQARQAIERFGFPVVLKADGLAAGKGVVIAEDQAQAEAAFTQLEGKLVIEEFLGGEEVSFIALCDGRDVIPLAPTQDHKAAYDGDTGPNTGGMGAYCASSILTETQTQQILRTVIYPAVDATAFTGFLYAGLMMTADGPKVLEFNVRLGDPETQPLMHRMQSDFVSALLAAAEGKLSGVHLQWRPEPSVCVVMCSGGYPGAFETGKKITGIADAEATGAAVFHAGTRESEGSVLTAGGRVLGVTARGISLKAAIQNAYVGTKKIHFDGMHYRSDIGRKGITRETV